MSTEQPQDGPGDEKPPQRTRRVPVRQADGSIRPMQLPEDVAGHWDDDQWHNAPPGV